MKRQVDCYVRTYIQIEKLELEKSILTKNLLGLLKTAQLELSRKQRTIDELRGFAK